LQWLFTINAVEKPQIGSTNVNISCHYWRQLRQSPQSLL